MTQQKLVDIAHVSFLVGASLYLGYTLMELALIAIADYLSV